MITRATMVLERKDSRFAGELGPGLAFDVKSIGDTGEFEGYAVTFGNVDDGRDITMPGAFDKTLQKRPAAKVKMLRGHDPDALIGAWTELREDGKGLFAKGQLLLELSAAREAHVLMRAGQLDGLSIGYRTLRDEIDRTTGTRKLLEVDLFEVSIVTFPMNDRSRVALVKSAIDAINTLSDAEGALREAGYSRKEARDFVSRVKRIAQREAGDDRNGLVEAMQKLTQRLRS